MPPEIRAWGKLRFDVGAGVDEIAAVEGVFFNPGRNREHIRVKDDVRRREVQSSNQQVIASLADGLFALEGIGLAGFVERHHHNGRPIFQGTGQPASGILLHRLSS